MNSFNVQHVNYEELVVDFAKGLDIPVRDNQVCLPETLGKGFIRGVNLDNGVSVLMAEAVLRNDLVLERPVSKEEAFYILHFHEIQQGKGTEWTVAHHKTVAEEGIQTGVHLGSSLHTRKYAFLKDAHIRTVNIIIPKNWVYKIVPAEGSAALLEHFIAAEEPIPHLELMDIEYRLILKELLRQQLTEPLRQLYISNRVMLLIEKFFNRLYHKDMNGNTEKKRGSAELQRLVQVEQVLIDAVHSMPPTIEQLAKMAAMSSTKLKSLFKEVFGMPVYEYYQYHRMQVAKEMLLTRNHTVKEVGRQVGYQNISHFAAAFKKIHKLLPSQLLGSIR